VNVLTERPAVSGNGKRLTDRIEPLWGNTKLAKEYGEKGQERSVSDLNLAINLTT
jgi:hypothetical protein